MEIYDSLNNQFKLYNHIAKLNIELLQYLENNNININYYCFFLKVIDNKHYIITSQTTKRVLNGYRLITIQDTDKDNNIFAYNDSVNIIFENIHINVTSIIDDVSCISKNLGIVIKSFKGKSVKNETIDCSKHYDKNILESKIIKITNVVDLIILNNFENLKELTFGLYHNQIISANVLPNSLQTLTFGGWYDKTIDVNVLPNSLQTLTFGCNYNQTIGVNVLPNSLQTLTFGFSHNQAIGVNVLPNLLQTLTFGYYYNQAIGVNVLPNSLQTLTFGYNYNQATGVNVLPNSLHTLTFGYNYNQAIGVNVLPNLLQTLTFNCNYNKTIDVNVLPNSLRVIYFNLYNLHRHYYREYKNHIVPQAFQNIIEYKVQKIENNTHFQLYLITIICKWKIRDSLNNQFKLYNYITKLNIDLIQYLENNNININYYCFFFKVIDNKHYIITSQTTKRVLNGYRLITMQDTDKDNNIFNCNDNMDIIFENIHINITSIIDDASNIFKNFGLVIKNFNDKTVKNKTIDCLKCYDKNILESNIIKIINAIDLNVLNNFENLEELTFGYYYNQTIGVNVLPNSLQRLTFGTCYDKIIGINVLPNSLKILTFGFEYNQTNGVNVLPNSLQTLTFGSCYNQIIGVNVLPNSLQPLSSFYNQTIRVNVLPNSLQALTFGHRYNQIIGINILPNSLQTLTFGALYNQVIGENVLPNSLQTLTFGGWYNQVIGENVLPNSLQTLTFDYKYYQKIGVNVLPNTLQAIYFNINSNYSDKHHKMFIVPQEFKNKVKYVQNGHTFIQKIE
jgi:hypothetical protein